MYWRFTGRGDERTRFNEEGQLLDAATYARLRPGEAAEITYDMKTWSFWSAPYDFADSSSAAVVSPSPKFVLQLRVDFASTAGAGGEVEFIEIRATKPPLAEEVVGEIYPPEVALGATAQFSLSIEPTIRAQHSGFDRIQIATPFGLAGVDMVKIGRAAVPFKYFIEDPDSTHFRCSCRVCCRLEIQAHWWRWSFALRRCVMVRPFRGGCAIPNAPWNWRKQ